MATIDSTLTDIMKMDYNSRELLLEILQKRQAEARRGDIAKAAKQSLKDYQTGKITPINAEDTINWLNFL